MIILKRYFLFFIIKIKIFSLCRFKNEPQQPEQPISPSSLILRNKRRLHLFIYLKNFCFFLRSSNHSILEIPFSVNNSRSSVILANQQGPPTLVSNNTQRLSNSLLITTTDSSHSQLPKPKIHPLRREESGDRNDRRDSSPWPFPAIHMDFHKQTSEIKTDSVFFNT